MSQKYENHAYRPTTYNIIFLLGTIALVGAVWVALRERTWLALVVVLLAVTVVGALALLRVFVLRVQDRVIRLEMRVRMARLGLERLFDQLEHRQLIALRFASDAEIPALAQRALAEKLSADAIKRAVVDWQGDHFRT